jgi:hypothetical protein
LVKMASLVSRDIYEEVGRLCAYYSYLEGAVAQAIWLELRLTHDVGHPVTDRLQLRDSFKLLQSIHKRAGNTKIVEHLRSITKRMDALTERRNLLVHGSVIFDYQSPGKGPGVRWLTRRGEFNREPQDVSANLVRELVAECEALADDFSTIGRLY